MQNEGGGAVLGLRNLPVRAKWVSFASMPTLSTREAARVHREAEATAAASSAPGWGGGEARMTRAAGRVMSGRTFGEGGLGGRVEGNDE